MNAKKEFLEIIKGEIVICAWISYETNEWRLNPLYKKTYYKEFLEWINIEYDPHLGMEV